VKEMRGAKDAGRARVRTNPGVKKMHALSVRAKKCEKKIKRDGHTAAAVGGGMRAWVRVGRAGRGGSRWQHANLNFRGEEGDGKSRGARQGREQNKMREQEKRPRSDGAYEASRRLVAPTSPCT
jgi:hypothetical protein